MVFKQTLSRLLKNFANPIDEGEKKTPQLMKIVIIKLL